MIIKMLQTITNTFSESGDLESSYTSEQYTIQPEKGKFLKNINYERKLVLVTKTLKECVKFLVTCVSCC